MSASPTPGLVARWTVRRRPGAGERCDECGATLTDIACDGCGQLAGHAVGMLATVVESEGGLRLVVAQRTGRGDWTPVRTMAATAEAVRAIARPGGTGPDHAPVVSGGLW